MKPIVLVLKPEEKIHLTQKRLMVFDNPLKVGTTILYKVPFVQLYIIQDNYPYYLGIMHEGIVNAWAVEYVFTGNSVQVRVYVSAS